MTNPMAFSSPKYDAFNVANDPKALKYRDGWSSCVTSLFQNLEGARKTLVLDYLSAYCRGIEIQLERNSREFLEGGELANPSDVVKHILKSTPTNNIHCERPFAVFDRKSEVHTNADYHTLCALTGATVNQSFEQLRQLPIELQDLIVSTAVRRAAKDRAATNAVVAKNCEMKDRNRIERQKRGIEKLDKKMEQWYLSKPTEFIATAEGVQALREKLSNTAFIAATKSQMKYLVSHRGLNKKKDLFVYKDLDADGFQERWEAIVHKIASGETELQSGGLSPFQRSIARINKLFRESDLTTEAKESIDQVKNQYGMRAEEIRSNIVRGCLLTGSCRNKTSTKPKPKHTYKPKPKK
jgi:hypothetical protein